MTTGFYGDYGGSYVPETLVPGARGAGAGLGRGARRPDLPGGARRARRARTSAARPRSTSPSGSTRSRRIYLKREDLCHTGAHKINNAVGQALLARRLGKQRIVAETGAGQHGVAAATVCARFGLECVVYMGSEDMRRQQPERRAHAPARRRGAAGRVRDEDAQGGDERGDPRLDHERRDDALPDRLLRRPHPYPEIVRELQAVIGREAREQMLEVEGRLPEAVVACVGGGSNAIGIFAGFLDDADVRLIGVEAAGAACRSARAARASSTARARRSSPTRTGRSRTRTRSPPASTTRASGRSTRSCATSAGRSTAPRPTRRRSPRSTCWPGARASSRRSSPRTRSRGRSTSTRRSILVGLSGRGDKDLATVLAARMKKLSVYLMAGPETPELAAAAVDAGADLLEIGFPFSDPLADGPVIRLAGERALAQGMRTKACLECLAEVRARVDVPLIPMTYASLLEAYGYERFWNDAKAAGATSLIVADLPVDDPAPSRSRACTWSRRRRPRSGSASRPSGPTAGSTSCRSPARRARGRRLVAACRTSWRGRGRSPTCRSSRASASRRPRRRPRRAPSPTASSSAAARRARRGGPAAARRVRRIAAHRARRLQLDARAPPWVGMREPPATRFDATAESARRRHPPSRRLRATCANLRPLTPRGPPRSGPREPERGVELREGLYDARSSAQCHPRE